MRCYSPFEGGGFGVILGFCYLDNVFNVVFRLAYFVVNYLNVSFHGLMTSVEEDKSDFSAIDCL